MKSSRFKRIVGVKSFIVIKHVSNKKVAVKCVIIYLENGKKIKNEIPLDDELEHYEERNPIDFCIPGCF